MTVALLPADRTEACQRLESYLRGAIPLVSQMQVHVVRLDEVGLELQAPLQPNRNHMGTAFGGSLHGLATLTAWGLLWLLAHGEDRDIVVRDSRMSYRRPVTDTLIARCPLPDMDAFKAFSETLQRRGRARIRLEAVIIQQGSEAAGFQGEFAVLSRDRTP